MFLGALLLVPPAALYAASNEVLWIEAEDYSEQRGSRAAHFAVTSAWGGACVDNDWGGREGDFLRYRPELPTEFPALHVTLRYARQTAGGSVVRVTLDGDTHQSAIVTLPAAGDWGFKPEGWKYVAVVLRGFAEGRHTLEIRSLADRNNVNFDGFYLSAKPLDTRRAAVEPPSGPESVAALGDGLCPLSCKTPVALPYSRHKAFVAGSGLLESLLSTPKPRGMGGPCQLDRLLVRGDRPPTAARPWRPGRRLGGRGDGLSDTTASARGAGNEHDEPMRDDESSGQTLGPRVQYPRQRRHTSHHPF
ncbi:MAG TPA: hypothetical protein VMY37_22540 [Thermoguttaceae bacterium]|nr:hypothetical protein [Thermoguttaceae bacterium]